MVDAANAGVVPSAISNQQSVAVARTELPQVWYVRIPDPDCRDTLKKCETVTLPVDGYSVQEGLWKLDVNKDHVFNYEDLGNDPVMAFPGGAARRLAELWTGIQYMTNASYRFASSDAALNLVRAQLAVDKAQETVQFLKSLPSHRVNGDEHEYNAADWQAIVKRLGTNANGYVTQVRAAAQSVEAFIASAQVPAFTLDHEQCYKETCSYGIDAWVMDPRALPTALRGAFVAMISKFSDVNGFAAQGEIECEGFSCPSGDESERPYANQQHHFHGPRIALRQIDGIKGEQVFLQLSSPLGWSNKEDHWDYLPERLANSAFIATSFSK